MVILVSVCIFDPMVGRETAILIAEHTHNPHTQTIFFSSHNRRYHQYLVYVPVSVLIFGVDVRYCPGRCCAEKIVK